MKYMFSFSTAAMLFSYIMETVHPNNIFLDRFSYAFFCILLLIVTVGFVLSDEIKKDKSKL